MHTPKPRSFCFNVYLPIICTVPTPPPPPKREKEQEGFSFLQKLCVLCLYLLILRKICHAVCVSIFQSLSLCIWKKKGRRGGRKRCSCFRFVVFHSLHRSTFYFPDSVPVIYIVLMSLLPHIFLCVCVCVCVCVCIIIISSCVTE